MNTLLNHRQTARLVRLVIILIFLVGIFGFQPNDNVRAYGPIYVKAYASGADNGSSWEDAYTNLQSALAIGSSGAEIWVAAGTYYPTTGSDRAATFALVNGVSIYGGFVGTESSITERNPKLHVTILSGDIGIKGDNSDNSYHVVTGSHTDSSAVLDGFTITAGQAFGISPNPYGGGMFNYESGNATLSNLIFSENRAKYGGGMFNFQGSSPTLTNVTFSGNTAERAGGMYNNENSHPTLVNVTFSDNTALTFGGGMTLSGSHASLTNVTFTRNKSRYGAAISNVYLTSAPGPTLKNVTISGNMAFVKGGGIYNESISDMTIVNSIIYGNSGGQIDNTDSTPVVSYSVIEGGYSGISNLSANPLLAPLQDNGGFTKTMAIGVGSSALDSGSDTDCPVTDQRSVARPQIDHCDIGAYEKAMFPTVFSVTRADRNLGISSSVNFTVIFSDSVTGVDVDDFSLSATGVSGASVTNVVGSGMEYTVSVSTGSGNGTIRLDVIDNNTIMDDNGRLLGGTEFGDGSYTSGEEYWVLKNANVNVLVSNNLVGDYEAINLYTDLRPSYTGVNNGPMEVRSMDHAPLSATQRVIYGGVSYSEMMGLPAEQLTKEYLFPYYNNVAMDSQLRVSNLGGVPTTITVYLAGQKIDEYTLAAGGATRKNYTGKNSGPLQVTSSASNILTTIRVLYGGSSYSELMGFPANQLSQSYWYPVYDNSAVNSQLRVSNVGSATTHVTVYAGTEQIDSYDLAKGGAVRMNYPKNTGPLQVVSSSQPILTTIRMLYTTPSFASLYEITGLPESQLSTRYFFPWYNNYAMSSQLRFAVP